MVTLVDDDQPAGVSRQIASADLLMGEHVDPDAESRAYGLPLRDQGGWNQADWCPTGVQAQSSCQGDVGLPAANRVGQNRCPIPAECGKYSFEAGHLMR
jgi:hypothetical protein